MKTHILIIGIIFSMSNIAMAAPAGTAHGKNLNIGQIEFLDQSKANNGQKIIGSVTTPMVYNGLYTQDIGAIVLSDDYVYGNPDSVFPNKNNTLTLMDFVGYEVAAREYNKAVSNIKLYCSTDPVFKSTESKFCQDVGRSGNHTICNIFRKKGATCNEHVKAFQDYLSKDYFAPDIEAYQVCIANCNVSGNNDNEDRGHDPNDSSKG